MTVSGIVPPRDAIIVLPGINPIPGTSLSAVARRLAIALDNNAPAAVSFRAGDERLTSLGATELRVATVTRRASAHSEAVPVADLIELDYRGYLHGDVAQRSPLRQALLIARTILFNTTRLLRALVRPSQRFTQTLQVLVGALLFAIMVGYFLVLAYAAIGGTIDSLTESLSQDAAHKLSLFGVPAWLKTAIVAMTGLGLVTRINVKATLAHLAPTIACTADYLSAGDRRSEVLGELTRLLDQLDEQTDVRYRRVHIIGYSFGSIIALDALFPREAAPSPKLSRVHTLVTIGCPFDFIRTYWPAYFKTRHAAAGVPRRWINVYCELDIFGSNFVDETRAGHAEPRGVDLQPSGTRRPNDPDNLSFGPNAEAGGSIAEYASFIGFRAHSVYWDPRSENALSCFEPITRKLYPEPLLPDQTIDTQAAPAQPG